MNYRDEHFRLNQEYEVISIFDQVINLQLEDRVYSIFNSDIKEAPYSLILESHLFNDYKSMASIHAPLYIGNEKCQVFSSYLAVNENKMLDISVLDTVVSGFKRGDSIIEKAFQKKRQERDLIGLIGLGLGLTPSGDDYIVGMMAAYYAMHQNTPELFEALVTYSATRTNFISHNYIRNAKDRLFKKEIMDVVQDISNPYKIEKLLSFGSSSGQDVLYGIYDYYANRVEVQS